MSATLLAELAATCNALGYSDGVKYFTDPQCEEAVKDLIRYLRRDDEDFVIRRHLGEAKILQTDLILILKQYNERKELFDHVLRLLVNLTYSALVLYNAELPEDKQSRYYYLQIISHLQSYKEAFIDEVVWAVLCRKLGELLNIEWQDRSEEEGKTIERILTLTRNVLQVPADTDAEKRPDNDATIHDQVLWALYQSGFVGLLQYIISSKHEDKFHMHILEIISQMLREQNPEYLAHAEGHRSIVEKTRDEAELLAIRQKEAQERHQKNEKYAGLRESSGERPRIKHYWGSRFAGTYVVKDMKSISNNDLIYHKPLSTLAALDLNHDKKLVKKPKNKIAPADHIIQRRSTLSVRLFLKEFCIEFLNGAYNTLMYSVKEMIHHGKNQVNDESYYLWAMKFFMEFNRHFKGEMKFISETMSLSTFHFIQTQIENYQERILVEKKKIHVWARRMHLALRTYQELLMTLGTMDSSTDSDITESARIIKSNIFYVVEYRELILFLLVNFSEAKFSHAFLKDLLETVHIFLKLLQQFCSKSRNIVVQEKQKAKRQKSKKKNNKSQPSVVKEVNPEEIWDSLTSEVISVVENQTEVPDNIVPFDSTSEVPLDEQKVDAVKNIQTALREKQFELAVGLLRASREVWPENDSFGAPNPAPEEEMLAMKDIFLADLGQPIQMPENTNGNDEPEENEEEQEEDEDQSDDDGGRERSTNVSEKTFQFIDFVKRFCNPRVVQACGLMLRHFDQNSLRTNHSTLKVMHRIAWDCKLPAMMFQASMFRTFQRILESVNPQHKEMKKFAVFIIRKFVEAAKENPKVYMELLFWKNNKEAYEVECGYGNYQSESHSGKQAWGEEEEDELRRLYEEYMALPEKPADEDMIDWILRNLISDSRSRRGIIKKLKELGYVVMAKATSRKSVSIKLPAQWSSEEEEQLTALFHQFKDAYDPLGCIMDRLTVRRPKPRIVDKLLAMDLIEDKKEMRKKRGKKNRNLGDNSDNSGGDETDINEDVSDEESEPGEDPSSTVAAPRRNQRPEHKKSKTKQKKSIRVMFSEGEACRLVKQVRAAGMNEALEWLAECLEDAAEDAGDSSEEAVPLLPLTESCIVAMDSPLFQQLLQSLGIKQPSDEQESYWRIPGHLTAAELRNRKSVIETSTSEEFFNTEDFDQYVAEECRKTISQGERDLENEMENEDESVETSMMSTTLSLLTTPQSTPNVHSVPGNVLNADTQQPTVSDFPKGSEEDEGIVESSPSTKKHFGKKKLKVVNFSSDSEDDLQDLKDISEDKSEENSSKRLLDSDSESESPKVKKHCQILLSDEED